MRKSAWIMVALGACAGVGCDGGGGSVVNCDGGGVICFPDGGVRPDGSDDAGPAGDTGVDGGPMRVDAGRCGLVPGQRSGATCQSGNRCLSPLQCQMEIAVDYAMGTLEVLPDGGVRSPASEPLRIEGFPGSMCAEVCDPDAAEGSPENDCDTTCARCNGAILAGNVRFGISTDVPGTCRPICNADHPDSPDADFGCDRERYACDPWTNTCMEACVNDTQCRFRIDDVDGDGMGDIVYDPALNARCDSRVGRCYVEGNDSATAGDPCRTDRDCMDNGLCIQDDEAIPAGYCVRLFCDDDDLGCPSGDTCFSRPFFGGIDRVCLDGCRVGAELDLMPTTRRDAAILGTMGGNPECGPGQMCIWDGRGEPSDPINGGCWLGNYNTETTYDVGTACLTDADCYSPFGYGRCLFTAATDRVQSGICAISNCAGGAGGAPIALLAGAMAVRDLPTEWRNQVCNTAAGDLCVNFGGSAGPPNTFCIHSCTAASECPAGYACPELLSDGTRICWPNCTADADCRSGSTCRDTMGGACDPMMEECFCSDARPAPDGGPPDADAGSAADGGVTESDADTAEAGAG